MDMQKVQRQEQGWRREMQKMRLQVPAPQEKGKESKEVMFF
jgi:hypothetical protein